jgi:CelD/BcsL family acetyltransferase involved in cellulose biosynthesis
MVPTVELLAASEAAALLAEHPEWARSVFTTPVWWTTAVDVLGAGRDVRIAALRDDQRLTGVVGVVVDPERGLARLVGDPISDRTGPLHAVADTTIVADRLAETLDHLVPDHVPFRTDGLDPAFRHADPSGAVLEVPCPTIRLDRDWETYLSGPIARRRRRIAGAAANLLERPDVEVTEHTTPPDVDAAFHELARLHELRFGPDHGLFRDRLGTFLRCALGALAATGGATIRTLHVREVPAAAILLLRHGTTVSYYQSGWDPTFGELSVGRALLADTIRREFARSTRPGGPRTFELLRGDEGYKRYWADGHDVVLELSRPARDGRGWPDGFAS